jgi:ribosomal protein L11 methylase PrmA
LFFPFAKEIELSSLQVKNYFEVAVMNMIRTFAVPLLSGIELVIREEGLLVWSGLLIQERNLALESAFKYGFSLFKETKEDKWWCGVFKKK